MSAADDLRILYATYPKGKFVVECIELSHSLFTKRYFFTREPLGITATITNVGGGTEPVFFEGTNIESVLNQKKSDLDSNFAFTLADPDNILDDELGLIPLDDTEDILCIYRIYNNDDFTEEADIHRLEVLSTDQKKGVFTIQCGLSQLNWQQTGIIYDYDIFPMLRAL